MAINVTDVKTFKFYAHKVMPLVYDDSLSYYEFLCKVLQKLNEVISSNNQQNEVLEDFDREINEWELETDELFQQYKAQIDAKIEKMETAVMGMQVEASTLEAGSEVTVSIELNEQGNYVISFGIPQGEKGDTGYPTQEQVTSAVTTWLVNNVDPVGSAVVVDASLSVNGAAADAKVTGENINLIENSNDITFSLTGTNLNSKLYQHNFITGDKINIKLSGNRANLVGVKSSDDTIVVLINNMQPSEQYTSYTFAEDIKFLGLYLYDITLTSIINIISDEHLRLYNKAINHTNVEMAKKVYGIWNWNEDTETSVTSEILVYGTTGQSIHELSYSTGNYAKCAVNGSPKVRVKGYGWNSSSN